MKPKIEYGRTFAFFSIYPYIPKKKVFMFVFKELI